MQFAISNVFSQQNSVSFCPAKCACYSRYLLTSYFCIPVPYNEKGISFGCYFQKVLQVFMELFNFSFFSITEQDIDLDYCDIEWFALEMNRDHSVGGICNFLGSVLLQQKFEAMDRPVLQPHAISLDGPLLQLSFIQKAKENTCQRQEGWPTQKT